MVIHLSEGLADQQHATHVWVDQDGVGHLPVNLHDPASTKPDGRRCKQTHLLGELGTRQRAKRKTVASVGQGALERQLSSAESLQRRACS